MKVELAAGNVASVMPRTKPARLTTWFSSFDAIVVTVRNGPPPTSSSCQPRHGAGAGPAAHHPLWGKGRDGGTIRSCRIRTFGH
jgi:hypothetical protein